MKNRATFVMFAVLAIAARAAPSTLSIECPAKFPAESVKFSAPPTGWTPTAPHSLELGSAEVMHGPPSSFAYAAPSTYKLGKRRDVGTWGMGSGENWVQCGYGARGELRLSRQLPAGTSSCTITKDKDAEGNLIKAVALCSQAH